MRKVHEKSVLLGIGIGMIITAIAGMIFSTGNQKELSKEEIISRAKGYGLVEQVKIINEDNLNTSTATSAAIAQNTAAASAESTVAKPSTAAVSSEPKKEPVKEQSSTNANSNNVRDIKIEVLYSYGSRQVTDELLEKGVITDKEKFTKVLDSYNAATKIRTGTFMFKKNDDLDYIVKTICKMK